MANKQLSGAYKGIGWRYEQVKLYLDKRLKDEKAVKASLYKPEGEEKQHYQIVSNRLLQGYDLATKARPEFSDMSLLDKNSALHMAYSGYQPGNGEAWPGDEVNSWKSNAMRLVERNKVNSIAGHGISRLGLLRQEAASEGSVPQEEAARVMNTLMTWTANVFFSRRDRLSLMTECLVAPAGILHVECLRDKNDDIDYRFTVVPCDQIYIENFFEPDIQKQGYLVWRKVKNHESFRKKWGNNKNWDFVIPGYRTIYNDLNGGGFYDVYEEGPYGEMDEEITTWDQNGDVITTLNGIVMEKKKNPREDGLYPFAKSGYQVIRENCFYYASLVHIAGYDARIINTLYPLIIDTAIWNARPPSAYFGRDKISSSVLIPGAVVSLSDKDGKLQSLTSPLDLSGSLQALQKSEESLNQATDMGPMTPENLSYATAYAVGIAEQRRNEALGPFAELLVDLSAQISRLVKGDVIQHYTLPAVASITGDEKLTYRSFLVKSQKDAAERFKFEKLTGSEMEESMKSLEATYKARTKTTRIDPTAFRKLKFASVYTDDILQPKSEQYRLALSLQILDKLIAIKGAGGNVDLDTAAKDLLLRDHNRTAKDPDRYFMAPQPQQPAMAGAPASPPGSPPIPGMPQM